MFGTIVMEQTDNGDTCNPLWYELSLELYKQSNSNACLYSSLVKPSK